MTRLRYTRRAESDLDSIAAYTLRGKLQTGQSRPGDDTAALGRIKGARCRASTMEMTMRYAHLSPDVRRDAVRLLDGPVPAAPPIVQDTIGARSGEK